ncbi:MULTISPECIES: alpha/beta hydrolase [unclassified Staphylococcus]|uniref:RBBP9/YdeN family alpha/beta hydrolase n=1 Tax=unclassified Staphylococcus TaxID=91994 RepID=UPI0021D3E378|nr:MULTISPECIES: alpha/beta hydrolase [unclassified Staphylococcus]UXR68920.1 alpha/beta hydrolase [Staphylococcus sp. IVB6246]UXR73205.1 alpha/beta hydrolase [Staphylococcus sp. IVB6238]UXR75503.1 alpha/beta hydrolase [Staphylococcus sp. IVB6233]UXR79705.1 alpha/beta hydrolase [Staphylococcus sp. IVB6218]
MTNVYIIHGYQANSQDHWFPWLKKTLEIEGHNVTVLDLPHTDRPNGDEWLSHMQEHIKDVDRDTIFISHSLGVITTLKFINELDVPRVGSLAMISGFKGDLPQNELLPDDDVLDSFFKWDLDYELIHNKVLHMFGVAAKDDYVVPIDASRKLCEVLDCKLYEEETGGHFCKEDGYDTFMFLKKKILKNFD